MASFIDMLNQGLGGLNTPLGQLGTQMMLSSGPQAGNPSGGARLGQAFVGMQQQQAQQQEMQQQAMLRQIQQQELLMRGRALASADKKEQGMAAFLQSPEAQNLPPMARAMIGAGYKPADVAKLSGGGQKQATPPGMYDMPQPDGTYIRNVVNPQTGQLEQSVPFMPPQAQTAQVAQGRLAMDQGALPIAQGLKERQVSAAEQNAQTAEQRVATQQAAEQRQRDAAQMTSKFKRLEFKQAYRGAVTQLDEAQSLAREIANSKALPNLYGMNGYIPPVAGTDAADLQAKIDRLVSVATLTGVKQLKDAGVSLNPMTENDRNIIQKSVLNPTQLQSDVQARKVFSNYADVVQRSKDEAAQRYNEFDSLYDVPGTSEPQKGPTTFDASNIDAGYNALPSGAEFIGPDGVRRRKP
jgi:hypothetical protein